MNAADSTKPPPKQPTPSREVSRPAGGPSGSPPPAAPGARQAPQPRAGAAPSPASPDAPKTASQSSAAAPRAPRDLPRATASSKQPAEAKTYGLFVPLLLLMLTLLVMAGFQTGQLLEARQSLLATRDGQEKALEDSRNVREQLESLSKGITVLASGGNETAARLAAQLQQLGVATQTP